MKKQKRTKLVHEGRYLAEVDVELLVTDDEWSPYLSVEDAYKLDFDARVPISQAGWAEGTRSDHPALSRSLDYDIPLRARPGVM